MHLHTFTTINSNKEGFTEICTECKFKNTVRTGNKGRIDNKKYLELHKRDYAQPNGRTKHVFDKYYGEEAGYISKFK